MHNNTDKLVIALLAFAIGFVCCDIYNAKYVEKDVKKSHKEVQYELKRELKSNSSIKDIEPKGKAQELVDFQDMDKKFYTYLENCEPLNIKTKNGYIEYLIEGKVEDKCLFKHRQIGFMDTICSIPMDVAKKYSEEGMNIIRQLEDLRAQNKSGFVGASSYINDINNDKTYCRYEYYQKKNK